MAYSVCISTVNCGSSRPLWTVTLMEHEYTPPHLCNGSGDALPLPGDGAAGAGESGGGGPGLEGRHGLRDAAGQGELLSELDVRASLC